ncbi:DNA repair protein rhp54 [Hordeum vulgare]|nr:DNA repair protein rhp54 [Hordeum vulgare]
MAKPYISPIVGLSSTGRRSSRCNMSPSRRVGRGGGIEAVEDHGDGEKARPQGKTNSKKEDKRDAASIALLEKVKGMIRKKDLSEEKRRQEKEEQIHAFVKIQRRRLEMDAKRQAKMLELEEAKQAKMLEIEATNGKTKMKEVALASMKMGVEIMKVSLTGGGGWGVVKRRRPEILMRYGRPLLMSPPSKPFPFFLSKRSRSKRRSKGVHSHSKETPIASASTTSTMTPFLLCSDDFFCSGFFLFDALFLSASPSSSMHG